MSTLVLPAGYTYEDRTLLEVEAVYDLSLMERYIHNGVLAKLADQIHSQRLMSGPAGRCTQCIGLASAKLDKLVDR